MASEDHGRPIELRASEVGGRGERWSEAFLEANRAQLARLGLTAEPRAGGILSLKPADKLGAVPLLSPSNRRVVAGLLVRPRFRWPALGAVMGAVGFDVEPRLAGAPLVPGSAREVPPWLIAGPVLRRLEGLLAHRRREFVEREEERLLPRGRVQWTTWARRNLPVGRATSLPCRFAEPQDSPLLLAHVRWTLKRLELALAPHTTSRAGRALERRVRELLSEVGPGDAIRPEPFAAATAGEWVGEALEAMGWVREERGLGGARTLDGLAWDLSVSELWESWVRRFGARLAPQLGLSLLPRDRSRRGLSWRRPLASMGSLVPDGVLVGRDRAVFLDAKYKPHLDELARRGWRGLSTELRELHRADLHQALAYANLSDAPTIDTVLCYPTHCEDPPTATATLPSGRRRLRLHLLALPFGFATAAAERQGLERWRACLAG